MESLIKITLTALMLVFAQWAFAQEEAERKLYEAYLSGSKTFWVEGVQMSRKNYESKRKNEQLFDLAIAQYGLLNSTMKDKDEEMFDNYVDATEDHLEQLTKHHDTRGEAKALLSAVYGLKMAYSPWKGIYLGSKSSSLMDEALQESPESPLVWKLYANSKLFTPETWGGDKREALEAYKKAIYLYEKRSTTTENWLYLDTLAWLGMAYEKNGDVRAAIETYEKALSTEPDFMWVKNVLLPKAQQKANQ